MKSSLASFHTNLTQRVITGILLAAVIIAAAYSSMYSFMGLVILINVLALIEFYKLYQYYTGFPRNWYGITLSVSILTSSFLFLFDVANWQILLINIPIIFAIYVLELYLKSKHPITNLAMVFLAIFSITVPLALFSCIGFMPGNKVLYDPYPLLGCFFILWANDSGAYFTGRDFGRRKLFKRLSPNKTWEGSIGGAIAAILVAYLNSSQLPSLTAIDWLSIALIIIITGTFGDLIKSLMKRSLNIKDSGTLLPGHGGMLDRFDSLLGSSPFIFCYLVVAGYA
jgi:phosphatidate cytidylyltransferase